MAGFQAPHAGWVEAPADTSASVRRKKAKRETADHLPVHSYRSLLAHLGTRCRNTCQVISDPTGTTFQQVTELDPVQREALHLLDK